MNFWIDTLNYLTQHSRNMCLHSFKIVYNYCLLYFTLTTCPLIKIRRSWRIRHTCVGNYMYIFSWHNDTVCSSKTHLVTYSRNLKCQTYKQNVFLHLLNSKLLTYICQRYLQDPVEPLVWTSVSRH